MTLFVQRSGIENAGGGLFTRDAIMKGSYIIPYHGKYVTSEQIKQYDYPRGYLLHAGSRYIDGRDPQGRLIMMDGTEQNVHAFSQQQWDTLKGIGVAWQGEANLARFVNCGARTKRNCVFRRARNFPLGFVATRNIAPGEELLTTYGPSFWKRDSSDYCFQCGERGFLIECDTPNCRRSFHLHCGHVLKVPRGTWQCPVCVAQKRKL